MNADDLLKIAIEAEAAWQALLAEHPPGTYHEARNQAYRRGQEAILCAQWMERHDIAELTFVGPFGGPLPKKGDRLVLKAGAPLATTAPKDRPRVALRRRHVTVHDVFPGHIHHAHRDAAGQPTMHHPSVHWVGSGGYFCWSDLENFEVPVSSPSDIQQKIVQMPARITHPGAAP